jgi:hypothetical protein
MPLWGTYAHSHLEPAHSVVVSATNRRKLREIVDNLSTLMDQIEREIEKDSNDGQ